MQDIEITIVLPVFNEENTIKKISEKLVDLPLSKEIIIVNDGSTDNTATMLKEMKKDNCLRVVEHKKNYGKGAAIRTGVKYARGEFFVIQDGDLEQDPRDIANLLRYAKEKNLDVVFGSRVLNWGFKYDIRYVANMLFALITNILFKAHLTDIMTGYKLCKTPIIKDLKLNSNGFDIEPEITAKLLKRNINIHEIVISYNPRTNKEGKKICFWDSFKVIGRLLLEKVT